MVKYIAFMIEGEINIALRIHNKNGESIAHWIVLKIRVEWGTCRAYE